MGKLVDLKSDITKLQRVVDERNELLKKVDQRWLGKCEPCTLVNDAMKRGEVPKGTSKSANNKICEACPVNKELRQLGMKMERNLIKQRTMRLKIKKKYGKNRLVKEEWE